MTAERPYIYAPVQCGHCYTSLDHDGDWLFCPACKITWGTSNPYDEDAEARFYYEDDEACGSDNLPSDRSGDIDGRPFTVSDSACWLPLGHTSKHDYGEDYEFGSREEIRQPS